MINLQTTLKLKPERNQIDYSSKVLLLGSCFAENIGAKLEYFKFDCTLNPFGILFHPLAIEKVITRALNEEKYTEEDVFFENERWHCFEAHSQLSNSSKTELLVNLNKSLTRLNETLISATHIVLTFGTAWVYRYINTDAIVANCHKIPQKNFLKELLSPDEISESLSAISALIKDVNPTVKFMYTVSPVRHIKDGIVENSRSKAHLLAGIYVQITNDSKTANQNYFPAFEIMMDELRDYRFYKEDLIHPNNTAIEIIWDRFKNVWISSETIALQKEIDSIQKGLQHRPFNENSQAHLEFKSSIKIRMEKISEILPHVIF